MPHYKNALKEDREKEEARKRNEEKERQRKEEERKRRAEKAVAVEKERKTPRIYASMYEVPIDHPLRDQIAKIIESGEDAAADHNDCVRSAEVKPEFYEEMKKDWRARRVARVHRDNQLTEDTKKVKPRRIR
jgi:hypothetical protein